MGNISVLEENLEETNGNKRERFTEPDPETQQNGLNIQLLGYFAN